MREAQELERLRAPEAALCSLLGGEPPQADQARLVGVERQPEPGQTIGQVLAESLGVGLMLKPQHDVVGVPDDDHLTAGVPSAPVLSPEIEDVVQVDVGQQRGAHAPNAMGNFCFEVMLNYRRLERPWRVSGTE